MRTRPAILDALAIGCCILLSVALVFVPFLLPKGEKVIISVRNGNKTEVLHELSLSEDKQLQLENNGITLTVTVSGGEVFVSESSCADGVCANTGKISRSGQSIICAPAGVVVSIGGGGSDDDILAQ